uniref:uncharacterized protein si:dkeyp-117h8.4 isoform X1 n=1 Tax=Gasterosteus aculeatus aculeatus TaxID=481459 RepID=UPI001A99E3BD|nr:uncharacterized protein si:dkeyp-117h8.4 isoform X1 [Gasterosteus aculeatus aculeatus]
MDNMDELLNTGLTMNASKFKSSLERIIDKYSKLHSQDGALEVDLDHTNCRTLQQYIQRSKAEITQLESKSLTDLSEESMTGTYPRPNTTAATHHLDVLHEDGGADETRLPLEDNGWSPSDLTGLTTSSLEENQRSVSETDVQPEDGDQELEMSLRSHGGSLVELYPGMISRIGKAWRRKHVFEAADTVLRRYGRWRRHAGRSSLGSTFIVPMRHNGRNPEREASRTPSGESRGQCVGTETTRRPPVRTVNASPRGTRQEHHQPVLVMDFSGPSEAFEPPESSLNETFTVSQAFGPGEPPSLGTGEPPTFRLGEPPSFRLGEPPSLGPGEPPTFRLGEPPTFRLGEPPSFRLGEPPSACTFSPSRSCRPAAKAPTDTPSRSRRPSLNAPSLQADVCSAYASETAEESSDFYGSPVRRGPAWAGPGLGRSPRGFSRSPKTYPGESLPRASPGRSISTPPRKTLRPRDVHPWLHPQAAPAAGRLSFDSSLRSVRVSYSPKKLDEDFLKLYHKFVCQSRSASFSGLPCRFCARSSEAGRAPPPSSSALAALALSPHRSLLRKRHRELDRDAHPLSKRYRDEHCPSSPGSKRHGREVLRRRLLQPQYAAGPQGAFSRTERVAAVSGRTSGGLNESERIRLPS